MLKSGGYGFRNDFVHDSAQRNWSEMSDGLRHFHLRDKANQGSVHSRFNGSPTKKSSHLFTPPDYAPLSLIQARLKTIKRLSKVKNCLSNLSIFHGNH